MWDGHFKEFFLKIKDFQGENTMFQGLSEGEVKFQDFPGMR